MCSTPWAPIRRRPVELVLRAGSATPTEPRWPGAASAQLEKLAFNTNWSTAHPAAIELAARWRSFPHPGSRRCSSPRAGRRPWSPPGSSHASITQPTARTAPQGDRAPDRLSRRVPGGPRAHGRAGLQDAVRSTRDTHGARQQHEQLPPTAGRSAARAGVPRRNGDDDPRGRPGDDRDDHRRTGQKPAAASLRTSSTGLASASSPTATGYSSSPTRSSRVSVASGNGSPRAVGHPAGHGHRREGPDVRICGDGCRARLGSRRGAVHRRRQPPAAPRDHVRRSPLTCRDRAEEPRDLRSGSGVVDNVRATRRVISRPLAGAARPGRSSAIVTRPGFFWAVELVERPVESGRATRSSERLLREILRSRLFDVG